VTVSSRTIHDTDVAMSLRNRISALLRAPRNVIQFNTSKAPDIERGQVIAFDSSVDQLGAYPGPGTDGSWVGKSFVVTEVVHSVGPTSLATTIVAVDTAKLASIAVALVTGIMMGGVLLRLT
jgi:hypothetical protein